MKEMARSLVATAEVMGVELTEPQLHGYLLALKDQNTEAVTAALARCVKECAYFPRPAEIISRIPTQPVNTFLPEPELTANDRKLNAELACLSGDYLRGFITWQEYLFLTDIYKARYGGNNKGDQP